MTLDNSPYYKLEKKTIEIQERTNSNNLINFQKICLDKNK